MERKKITTEFPDAKKWGDQIGNYLKEEPTDIYARYDNKELREREKEFAKITEANDAALFNAGMGAVVTAIEAEDLKTGDVVLCGIDVYVESEKYFQDLKRRGMEIILINSGDAEEIEGEIRSKTPRLIILESTGNSPRMPVCDLKRLGRNIKEANNFYQQELNPKKIIDKYLKTHKLDDQIPEVLRNELLENIEEFQKEQNPFIFWNTVREFKKLTGLSSHIAIEKISKIVKVVIKDSRKKLSLIVDNTLSSPAIRNPLKEIDSKDAEMVVVESGTKHFQKGEDRITFGIAYSNNAEKIEKIRRERGKIGTYLQPVAEKKIPKDLRRAMPEIMKRHTKNALELANILDKSPKTLDVGHPNLESHKNSKLAKELAPEGLITVFYIEVPDAEKFVSKVKDLGGDKIGIGVSFGHKKTWLMNRGENSVRIAAGSESPEEFEKVMEIFKKAAE